ncbi:MAG: MBG domain-containing protein [Hylemonella sp.]|nr:MBG domain-containing protein [Hylemonella sp.]
MGSGTKTVTVAGVTVGDGINNANYNVSYVSNTTSSINLATLAISGLTANAKVYDTTRTATLSGSATIAPLGSDIVTLGGTAAALFDTKDAGTAKPVAVTGYAISGTDAGNYTLQQPGGLSANITRAPLGIAANSATRLYGDANPAFSATYSGFKGGETSAVLSGTLALTTPAVPTSSVGNYAITPSGQSASNYSISYVNGNLGVTPAPLGIAANSRSKTYGDTVSFTGTEFTSTGLKNSETIASVSLASTGAAPTAAVAGSPYAITASAATGGTFTAGNYTISYVDGTLGVLPAPLGIAANSSSKIYGNTLNFSGTEFTSTGLKNSESIASVSLASAGAAPTATVAGGPYAITASTATGGSFNAGNYTISYVDGTLGVTPAPLGIAANSATRLYGDANPAFNATYTGLKNGETSAVLGGTLALSTLAVPTSNVGNYAITPSGQSASNYTISYVNGILGVTPAPLGIAANSATRLYGDANPAFSATYSGFKNGEASTVLTGTLALSTPAVPTSDVGNYAITPSGQSATNYSISYVNGNLGVTPAPLGIAANSRSKTYGDTVSFSGTEFTSTGLKNSETIASVSLASAGAAPTAAVAGGPYAITASAATGGTFTAGNYSIHYVDGTLGVLPAPLGIAANSSSKIYGDTVNFSGTEFTSTGLKNSESIASVSLASAGAAPTAGVAGGPYAITASAATGGTFNAGNYTISYADGALGVLPAPLGIVANNRGKTYGETVSFSGTEFTSTGLRNSESIGNVSLASDGAAPSARVADSPYAITASAASGGTFTSGNYTISYVDGALVVVQADLLAVAANAAIKTYDGLAFIGGNGVTYAGFQSGDGPTSLSGTLQYGGTSQGAVNAGNYTIIPSGQSSTNYTIRYVNGNLRVTPAPLGIAANSATRLYGDVNPAFNASYTGFQNGETSTVLAGTLALSTLAVPSSNVGNYAITPSGQSSANYTISYVNGNLNVTPAPLGIAANSATRLYGDANPAFSAVYSGFRNGETSAALTGTLALSTPAVPSSSVGNYAITPSGQSASNYSISYVNGNLGVTRAPLGIAANSATRLYGDANPAFSATYTGLKNGETSAVLGGTLALTTPAVAASSVGNYAITPSGQSASNYSISYVNGNLGVTPAPLGIAANSRSKAYGDTVSFTGTEFTSTGLKNSESIASVSLASAGAAPSAGVAGSPYAVTASAATGGSFNAGNYSISYVDGTLGVIPAGLLGVAANAAVKAYDGLPYSGGNGVNYSGFLPGDSATSLSGTLQYGGTSQGAVNVGNYTIIPSGQSSTNYTISYVNGNLRVTPVPLGIAANSATRLYGDANPALSATYTGFQNGETSTVLGGTLAFTTPAGPTSSVGNYAITPSGQSSTNYTISYVNGNLGVTPAPLGIAANSSSKTYGDTVSFTGTEFSSVGLRNGESIGTVVLASAGAAPTAGVAGGPYAITASAATGGSFTPGNYTVSYVNGSLGVTAAPLLVSADARSKVYGSADPTLTFASTGLVNGDTTASVLSGALARAGGENVAGGPYAITQGSLATNGNYTLDSFTDGLFTITPATLVYTALPASFLVGQTPFGLSGSLSGFVLGDTPASATTGTLAWTSPVGTSSMAGSYPIIGGGLSAANYTFTQAAPNATALTLTQPVVVVDTTAVLQPLLSALLEERGLPRNTNPVREPTQLIDLVALLKQNPPSGPGTTSCNVSGEGSDSALNTLDTGRDTSGVFIGTMLLVRVEQGGVRMPANAINTKCDVSP